MSENSRNIGVNPQGRQKHWFVSRPKFCLLLVLCVIVVTSLIVGIAVYFGLKQDDSCDVIQPNAHILSSRTQDIKLPTLLLPVHYNVRFRPNIYSGDSENFYFNGTVEVFVNVTTTTKEIILHCKDLEIMVNEIKVFENNSKQPIQVDCSNVTFLPGPYDFMKISTMDDLLQGQQYVVYVSYKGVINKDMRGLYYSQYINDNGETVYLLTSQVAAIYARTIFPCMDEPALKATFSVVMERKPPKTSKSNMMIYKNETLYNGWIADFFETTPMMSTYLLAFVVSDFQCLHNYTKTGVLVEVCAKPPSLYQCEYSMSIAVGLQEWYEWYHNVSYPLSKISHVAIPDFEHGAMENWGLILYREQFLLSDTDKGDQDIATTVAHELAHMWFGDLVSTEWWDDLWINEGFASYMQLWAMCHDQHFSNWAMEEQFVVEELQATMEDDGMVTSHPVYTPIPDPGKLLDKLDLLYYRKGASVIRMMKYFLGEKTFRWGLSNYLKATVYGVGNHKDLFNYFSKQSEKDGNDLDVDGIMNTWIHQMGYPVVTYNYSGSTGHMSLTQHHFLLDNTLNVPVHSPYNYIWKVPISFMTSRSGFPNLDNMTIEWLDDSQGSIDNVPKNLDWIIGNVGVTFYYRVNYNEEGWQGLIRQLRRSHKAILTTNRAQILDDAFNLGRSGIIDQTKAFDCTRYMTAEEEYAPWFVIEANMGYIRQMIDRTEGYQSLKKYMQILVKNTYRKIGWTPQSTYTRLGWKTQNSENHIDKKLRLVMIWLACMYGNPHCLREATDRYSQWMQNGTNTDLASIVYCYGISEGGLEQWNYAYQKYQQSNSETQKSQILKRLGCTRDTWLIQRYLSRTLSKGESGIRQQDIRSVFEGVCDNPIGRTLAWNFFKANWKALFYRFGHFSYSLRCIIKDITKRFSTEWELNDLKRFVKGLESGAKHFQKAIESAEANIKWREKNEKNIINWLNKINNS